MGANAEWRAAVKGARGGVAIDVEVVPGSRESVFPAGFNAWRGRIEAKVRAPPEDGKANAELVALAASALQVPAALVRVASGHTSRRKTLLVEEKSVEAIVARLATLMEP